MSKLVPILAAAAALAFPGLARASDVAMRVQECAARTARARRSRRPDALQHARAALDRHRRGALPDAPAPRWVVGLDGRGRRCVAGRRHRLVARRRPRVDGRRGRLPVSSPRRGGAAARLRAVVAGHHPSLAGPLTGRGARDRDSVRLARERGDRPRGAEVAPAVRLAVVHHTAGANSYTPAQAAAIVRGIEVYHVQGNGWNDIGYNFLVDRFGTVYEGRAGGITRNVIGAHSEGFNSGTVGIALIGNFTNAVPPRAMQDALVKLLAWRLDVAHVDPLSRVVYLSGGNAKFKAGRSVTLRAISGHRDTGPSECPGNDAYALLPAIAKRVSLTGLPKLYSPTVAARRSAPSVSRPACHRRCLGRSRSPISSARQWAPEQDAARSWTGPGTPPWWARGVSPGRSPPRAHGRRRARSVSAARPRPPLSRS